MSKLKYQYGRLSYRKKSTGGERGREDWSLTRNRDGTVTMRCLAMTDDSKLVRDVIYTRRKEGRPVDAFIRLQVADQLIGSGYFRVQNGTMDVIADGNEKGNSVTTVSVLGDCFSIISYVMIVVRLMFF